MIDGKKRALLKAFSWRTVASIVLGLLTYLLTGNFEVVGAILIIFNIVQICTYFLHERLWNYISWGRTRGLFIQMTGMSGSGKTTLSKHVADRLRKQGVQVELIDGDDYRKELCSDLSFSKEDRNENIRRLSFVGRKMAKNNIVAIMAAINPYEEIRREIEGLDKTVKTVYIRCDLNTLQKRDPKGLYKRAMLEDGHPDKIYNFTGISDPFEEPAFPDLLIDTSKEELKKSSDKLTSFILKEISL